MVRLGGLKMVNELVKKARKHWDNAHQLSLLRLEIIENMATLASAIAAGEVTVNQEYLSIKKESYKKTTTDAKAEATTIAGGQKTKAAYQFQTLQAFLDVLTQRISSISELALPDLSPENPTDPEDYHLTTPPGSDDSTVTIDQPSSPSTAEVADESNTQSSSTDDSKPQQ
jgi:hypothetical protein